ncbi:MAG: hypothetical protein EOP06_17775, partial [Proteobacteria bacterium]
MKTDMSALAVPEYYSALDKIAEGLGAVASDARYQKEVARKELFLYSVPQIIAYLEYACPPEEAKRRESGRRGVVAVYALLAYMIAAVGFILLILHLNKSFSPFVSFISLPISLLSLYSSRVGVNLSKIRGLCVMLSEYAGVEQVPLLIDALHFVDTHATVKQKLATLLPVYLQRDEQPLNERQKSELASQLKTRLAAIIQQKNTDLIEQDVLFVAAALLYFEREVIQRRDLPKKVLPIL